MAIQNRRGNFVDFNPAKMLPGEWAVVQNGDPSSNSGTSIYMCFSVGNVKRMATYEDMVENINLATADVQAMFTADVQAAILAATQATAGANTVISNAQNAIADTNAAISRADVATANAVAVYEQLKDIDVAQLQDDINNLAEVARTGNSIDVNYNSLGSELEAINVQTAIDELSAKNSDLANTISELGDVLVIGNTSSATWIQFTLPAGVSISNYRYACLELTQGTTIMMAVMIPLAELKLAAGGLRCSLDSNIFSRVAYVNNTSMQIHVSNTSYAGRCVLIK